MSYYVHNKTIPHQQHVIMLCEMQKYISCLKDQHDKHYLCRELSREYLQCRMDRQLMASEDLDKLGFSEDAKVEKAVEYDKSKEKEGYVAGKHIDGRTKWWFQKLW